MQVRTIEAIGFVKRGSCVTYAPFDADRPGVKMWGWADVAGGWNCRNVIADPGEIGAAFNIDRCEGYLALFRTLRSGEACAAPARRGAAKALYIGGRHAELVSASATTPAAERTTWNSPRAPVR